MLDQRSPQAKGRRCRGVRRRTACRSTGRSRAKAFMPYTSDSAMPRSPGAPWPTSRNRTPGVAQARAQRLAGLQIFVRHGAQRRHAQLMANSTLLVPANCPGAAAPGGGRRCPGGPPARAAPLHARRGKSGGGCRSRQSSDRSRPSACRGAILASSRRWPSREVGHLLRVAEVHLVDDGQHRDLEQDGVQPGPRMTMSISPLGWGDGDVLFVEPEQPRKIHKVALDERSERR